MKGLNQSCKEGVLFFCGMPSSGVRPSHVFGQHIKTPMHTQMCFCVQCTVLNTFIGTFDEMQVHKISKSKSGNCLHIGPQPSSHAELGIWGHCPWKMHKLEVKFKTQEDCLPLWWKVSNDSVDFVQWRLIIVVWKNLFLQTMWTTVQQIVFMQSHFSWGSRW